MRVLILGGTVFVGRALVESLTGRGHEVTLFNRGQSNPELFPGIQQLHGDRKTDLSALEGKSWDAVIDTCGYFPQDVERSAGLLADRAQRYVFISSESVYADNSRIGNDESSPVAVLQESDPQEITGENYGALKALCEQAAEAALPGRALIIRPGLIVGPYDRSDRFTYWPHRVALGGEVLAPGRPERKVQFIDVRDLADWTVKLIEEGATGIFNATGPEEPIPMGDVLDCCKEVSGSDARFTWVDEAFLLEREVNPWIGLPLWIPESDPETIGFFASSIQKALQSGLTFRPLDETVRDTLAWADTRPEDYQWRAGLDRVKEAKLLKDWHERGSAG